MISLALLPAYFGFLALAMIEAATRPAPVERKSAVVIPFPRRAA